MLKPRYRTIGESVSDFNNLLEDMNKTQPLEHHKADQEVRARQDEERLRRELQHVENVIAGSGHFFTEREKAEWFNKRAQIAEMLGEEPVAIEESWQRPVNADPAINSQYESQGSALERFRVLAGIQEQTAMPRDAGIFGSTRHNANYDEIADQTLSESVSQDSSDKWRGSLSRLDESKKKELSEGGGSRKTKSDRQMAKLGRYTRNKEVDLKNPEVKTVLKHMYRPRSKPEDSLARDARSAKKMREHPAAMRKDSADYTMRKHDIGRSEYRGPKPKLPKDPPKKEDVEYQEGGGSRRSKAARQGKHYEKFAPAHLYTKSGQRDKKNMHKSWRTSDIDRRAMELKQKKRGALGSPDPKATGLQKGSVARSILRTDHQKRLEKKRK
jgi:hypothetical protein